MKQEVKMARRRSHSPGSEEHGRSEHSSRSSSPWPNHSGMDPQAMPPDQWLDTMLHSLKAALEEEEKDKKKKLVSIEDYEMHSHEDKELKLTSPRSIQSCLHLGIDLNEIVYRPFRDFYEKGVPKELQKFKYEHYEQIRKDKLRRIKEERDIIKERHEEQQHETDTISAHNISSNYKGSKDFNDKEQQRLEVMRRRQQRDLEQVAMFEAQRQQHETERQAKLQSERKAEAQKKLERARKEKEWKAEQRKREMQKMKEEEVLEKKSRQLAAERYLREQNQAIAENAQQRKLRKENRRKEQERLVKQEEFRKQMEMTQQQQQGVLIKKQEEMKEKEIERKKMLEEKNKERLRHHMEARKQAKSRHDAALENFQDFLRRREEEYQKRQEELKLKLQKQEEEHKMVEMEKKKKEEMRENQRNGFIQAVQAEKQKRLKELVDKSEASDILLQSFMREKEMEHARKMLERQLILQDKYARAVCMNRLKALHRQRISQRIHSETAKLHRHLESRSIQLERHRQASANLSLHRQSMVQQMEKLSISKKWRGSMSAMDLEELEEKKQEKAENLYLPSISEDSRKKKNKGTI